MKCIRSFLLASVFWGLSSTSACAESGGLAAALQATLEHHPALSGKRAEVEAKGYAGDSARAQRYPSVSGQVAAQNINNPNNANSRNSMTLRARQPIWAFGRIDSVIAYADADLTAEQADLLRVKRQFMDQTAVAYARVMGSQQRLRVAEDNVAILDKLHRQIQRREQGQLASVADVRLALARLVQARAQKERFQGELTVAESELRALTQVAVAVERTVPDRLTQLPGLSELERLAQERSADVLLKTRRIAVAQADVEREKTSPMPTVYLQADRYYNQPGYGNDVRVGVVMDAALDGLGLTAVGRSHAAQARLQAGIEDLNTTRNEISRLVRSLHANRQLQQNLISSQDQEVTELAEILASYRRQYEAGYKAWLEVLNMQRELTDQQQQLVQAENEWLINTLKLAALTGGLDALVDSPKEKP